MILKTKVWELMQLLKKKKKAEIEEISKELNWEKSKVELTAKVLEKTGLINVVYPANVLAKPFISLEKEFREELEIPTATGKSLLEYELTVDTNKGKVKILQLKGNKRPNYFLDYDRADPATKIFMEEIKEEIAQKISIEGKGIYEPSTDAV